MPSAAKRLDVELAEFDDEVLMGADVISLHTPLTDQTRGLIDAEARISRMKTRSLCW